MRLDERLRRHLVDEGARTTIGPGPTPESFGPRLRIRRRRRVFAAGAGLLAGGALAVGAVVMRPASDPADAPGSIVAPTALSSAPPPTTAAPPPSTLLTPATIVDGPADVDEYELAEAASFPDLVSMSADDDGFVLADPSSVSGWSFLRSVDGKEWTGVVSDLPADLVAAPSAQAGDRYVVFGGLRGALSAPWSERELVAAVTDDLGEWNIVHLPNPSPTPRRLADVSVFDGEPGGEVMALGALLLDIEAVVWERLPADVQADLVDALDGPSDWVLVVDGDRLSIELHRFSVGADRVLFESTIDELGLRDWVHDGAIEDDRQYVVWRLDADGIPEATEVQGLDLETIAATARHDGRVWALGRGADGAAALFSSADGVRWRPAEGLDLTGVQEPLELLVEPDRLTVYGVRDNLLMDWRSDERAEWQQRVVWEHPGDIAAATAIRGPAGQPVIAVSMAAAGDDRATVLATVDGGRNWHLADVAVGSELLAITEDTLLVRRAGAGARPYVLNRIELG